MKPKAETLIAVSTEPFTIATMGRKILTVHARKDELGMTQAEWPIWTTSQKELKNVGFPFDLSDMTKIIPETRPDAAKGARKANVFKWQAASEAERKSIKDWIRTHGSHAEAATLMVPEVDEH